ncbi:ATP-dependent DNA helicase PIF1-like [Ipomoea triloba]|uniref:ATP-dependent DNA helicase PIF1-like n=1 Tax=Ipomoea triloba TaxID=35885 RepID=UPI00125E9706|nr:ATP-dependent DNA helicase PIF1-like [Ipomoea triloba]
MVIMLIVLLIVRQCLRVCSLAWFAANLKFEEARELTYAEMPRKFVWKKDKREWHPRQRNFAIGRIFYVPPKCGELFYLRCLLNLVRGPTSFEEIKCVDGKQYMSFRDACYARGLIEDDKEYVDAILEASLWATAYLLRKLFVTLLTSSSMSKPKIVWEAVWIHLAEDAEYQARRTLGFPDVVLTDTQKKNYALTEIDKLLSSCNKSLQDYPPMPIPDGPSNSLLLLIYNKVMSDVDTNKGGLFFVYGYGGTGKTFLWKTLSAALRSRREIVLNVASSGIASLLLPGGRTAHSRFAIPISINEDSTCNIKQGCPLAELIVRAKLIIWDEAPMMHKHCFEALDKTMRDILRFSDSLSSNKTFGGKTVVLGGDFRQILPVIPKGTRQDIVQASDGKLGGNTDDDCNINIPSQFLLQNKGDPIKQIVEETFPSFGTGVIDPEQLKSRAILAPTLDVVDQVNEYMNNLNQASSKTYLSCDSVCKADTNDNMLAEVHTTEFLNSLKCSGVPNHSLSLKVGSPIMLLRNIDHSIGLCNGTRLIVTKLGNHVIEAKILCGIHYGTNVLIPRLSLTPSDPILPFKFQRKQFPVLLSYAMTINKSQGQTLSVVGLLLKKPVFNHGAEIAKPERKAKLEAPSRRRGTQPPLSKIHRRNTIAIINEQGFYCHHQESGEGSLLTSLLLTVGRECRQQPH